MKKDYKKVVNTGFMLGMMLCHINNGHVYIQSPYSDVGIKKTFEEVFIK